MIAVHMGVIFYLALYRFSDMFIIVPINVPLDTGDLDYQEHSNLLFLMSNRFKTGTT